MVCIIILTTPSSETCQSIRASNHQSPFTEAFYVVVDAHCPWGSVQTCIPGAKAQEKDKEREGSRDPEPKQGNILQDLYTYLKEEKK